MQLILALGLSALLVTVHGEIFFPGDAPGNKQPQIPEKPVTPTVNIQQAKAPVPVNSSNVQSPQQSQQDQHQELQNQQLPPQGVPPQQSPTQVVPPQQLPSQGVPPQQLSPQKRPLQQSRAAITFQKEEKEPEIPCTTYKGERGSCHFLAQCATFFAEIAELSRSPCPISADQQGVCCLPEKKPKNGSVGGSGSVLKKLKFPPVPVPNVGPAEINFAVNMGLHQIKQKESFEQQLVDKNVVAEVGSPVQMHAMLFQTNDKIIHLAKDADKTVAASVNLVKEFNLTKEQGNLGLPQFTTQNSPIKDTCPPEPICPQTRYRTMDGSCNNLRNKEWGMAGTAFERILPADYNDGVDSPRSSHSATPLPSPRAISSRITVQGGNPYENYTMLIMQWGQFLDHDITHTPITKGSGRTDITCCFRGQLRPDNERHSACLPIDIPPNDSFYSQHEQRCMEFVRSFPAVRPACNFGPREQMNQISSFIDSSNVYGTNEKEAKELRSFSSGELKAHSEGGRSLLPPNARECRDRITLNACFKAGDSRVNEQPNLAVMHTIWMRQHNRIAEQLQKINPGWTDEEVYQEARRIIIAQMQHITYKEYLPIILGKEYMEDFGLLPLRSGFANSYRENVDPTINNVFAAAAFRYGHTLISSSMKRVTRFGTDNEDLLLSKNQFRPFMLYNRGALDELLRGLSKQPSEQFDHFFTEELTNKLFAGNRAFGMDLVALNIQRGRDHGLPDYNSWRKICGLPKVTTFQGFRDVMDNSVIKQLESMYSSVDDVDIFIGGISEKPFRNSLLGHTFHCIVGDQFARLRLGDRFWYENGGMPSSFTENQLNEIRKTSLARIMCDNSDHMEMIQPLAFVQGFLQNKRALCRVGTLIPKMSLEPWRNSL
ncbi:unnamed protein product [Meganyctiphanes norvegica]|uniref:Peroxinectin n=1 Tax=Meganyctiphanes norvegica TaxID=48144 RepID=A0AAV2RE44_MEGNR